ncbi:hypothetical protein NEOLI_002619 [Neolecta irregularis DAH-3]|uniref:Uncharacterized protein n=1 Tax=Neolecta irregularis (strain DAH-3) TaxID=1198029 RepID=A0A1U7LH91_NEOID|nr:hypothetical protein NEOLI_002619 [Neolecta irregularis DAH-3]|eukprot:OLL22014.1 hypothetical protein NEOLI_002619 [Neolecta irregularis DAH-3]
MPRENAVDWKIIKAGVQGRGKAGVIPATALLEFAQWLIPTSYVVSSSLPSGSCRSLARRSLQIKTNAPIGVR